MIQGLCYNTGIVEFIKKLSELAVDECFEMQLDQAHKEIWYYTRMEVVWIISNIVASLDFDVHGKVFYSLFYDDHQDITQRKVSKVAELMSFMFGGDKTKEYHEQTLQCMRNCIMDDETIAKVLLDKVSDIIKAMDSILSEDKVPFQTID